MSVLVALVFVSPVLSQVKKQSGKSLPNIIIIYTDDLGYGDISANGAVKIKTPAIDRLADEGLRFTDAHTTSATCTPSRFSLLTGVYAWRRSDTKIARGDASLIIPTDKLTLASVLQKAGYKTGAVGKWHLGLGDENGPDWNGVLKPGPLELGFNYCYIMPATGDRVPCVYVENHKIVNLDPSDPITVNYDKKVGNWPTGAENPELLKTKHSQGHDNTIVNGVGRIGWMTGGKSALWVDENMADTFTTKALQFVESNKRGPFFLYFAPHDIHVPRLPNHRFVGKSGLGARGDAILELDGSVGQIIKKLKDLNIYNNTLIIFSSDNGPVVDDGYHDGSVENLNGHKPGGIYRGGKYSLFEAGTRVPFIVTWPEKLKPKSVTNARFSQVDILASLAALTGQTLKNDEAPDSYNYLNALLGKDRKGRRYVVEQSTQENIAITSCDWKYMVPNNGAASNKTGIELGNKKIPQLYNLKNDPGEKINLAGKYPAKVKELAALLKKISETNDKILQ